METEEDDALKNPILASSKEPEISAAIPDAQPDLGMNDAQFQLEEDASALEPPNSQLLAVVQETIEDEDVAGAEGLLVGNEKEGVDGENESAPSEGTELVMDSAVKEDRGADNNVAEENDTWLARVQSPPGESGEHDGVDISREDSEVVEESKESSLDKHDSLADCIGSDTAVAAETKGGAPEVVEEVSVAAFTYDPVVKNQSDYEESAVQDNAGNNGLEVANNPEEFTVSREPEDDDVQEQVDAAETEKIHEETDVGNSGDAGNMEKGTMIEGSEYSTDGDENEVPYAAGTDDMEVGGTPEDEVDENEEDAGLEVQMNTGEDDTEMVEPADDMDSLPEETDAAEETDLMEEMDKDGEQSKTGGGQKRKRGRTPKGMTKVTARKKIEEDVCFICYDGGDLVLCDRRGCPKAYHPSCVNRDEAFFHTKGRWNCGWHQCSSCGKNANYMCYTCSFSLCKGCTKDSIIYCHKGKKGFCETCMKMIKLIEDNLKGNKIMDQVDFDDKGSWEYLFKDYYIDLKEKLSLTLEEVLQAKSPWKGSDSLIAKQKSPDVDYNINDEKSDSENSSEDAEVTAPKRKQAKRRSKFRSKVADGGDTEWASKELLEFVMHMTNGEKTFVSQYDIQFLLLDYIKRNNLRDPKRKGQIICDARFENIFGKPRVGHVEMLKLLEPHYLIKEDADNEQGADVDTDGNQLELERNSDISVKTTKDKKRKGRRKGDGRALQSNLDDFAAIDTHNITLIYLRRNLLEYLLEDTETFHEKVVGSFVRIRIPGSNQKQDLYRLVPVVGTSQTGEPYKVGKRMTDYLLEILNLNKTEVISIDTLSNQEFTEMPIVPPEAHGDCRQYAATGKILLCKEECKRLRQSIKCGIIDRLTVGDIHERAMVLQEARVKDWLEAETVRLSHLRDRASDLGRRKELRECVEKLQLLKTPEERQRRMEEMPEIHADPKMDPSYESEEDEMEEDDKRQETYVRSRGSGGGFSGRGGREAVSPRKGGVHSAYDSLRSQPRELSRNMSGKGYLLNNSAAYEMDSSWSHARERESQQQQSGREQRNAPEPTGPQRGVNSQNSSGMMMTGGSVSRGVSETQAGAGAGAGAVKEPNETEKIWHYQDPTGKIQGPFSMTQLRKWNNTGYFPSGLRIWTSSGNQDNSILLNDALNGKYQNDAASASRYQKDAAVPSTVEVPKYTTTTGSGGGGGEWRSLSSTNLPSPTPGSSRTNELSAAVNGGGMVHAAAAAAATIQSQGHNMLMSNNPGGEVKLSTLNLQSLVQAVRNQTAAAASVDTTHGGGWSSAPVVKAEHPISSMPSAQQQPQVLQVGQWSSNNAAGGYANPWRPPPSGVVGSDQPRAAAGLSAAVVSMNPNSSSNWGGYGNPNNLNAGGPDTQSGGWVQQKMGAAGGWGGGGSPQVQVQSPGWVPPPPTINVNPAAAAFVAAAAGPQTNPSSSWHAPAAVANQATMWTAADQTPNQNGGGGYYQGQRSSTSSRGESGGGGYNRGGGSRSWNNNNRQGQSGGGNLTTRTPAGVCRFFFETGHCKKGASCNYRHN